MSNTPNFDLKVKAILAELKPGERTCEMTGEKWLMDEEEIGWYRHFNVPPSTLCPQIRNAVMYHWSNGTQWWWNRHAETGKPILSYIHPATGIKILPDIEWHTHDFSEIAFEIEAHQPFIDQLHRLVLTVPFPATRNVVEPTNSIAAVSLGDTDSYFVLGCRSRGSFFSQTSVDLDSAMEVYQSRFVEESYNVVHSRNIHHSIFVRESENCSSCVFIFDCHNCEFCYGATNKRNKKYLWFNEQLTKEDWEVRRAAVNFSCRSVFEEQRRQFFDFMRQQAIWPERFQERCDDLSSGEYLYDCLDCKDAFYVEGGRRLHNCGFGWGGPSENSYSSHGLVSSSECHLTLTAKRCQRARFSYTIVDSRDLEYCMNCYSCESCFACVGLRNKRFCILNKQYDEKEYWVRVDELRCAMLEDGSYGRFFPASWSPGYAFDSGMVLYSAATEREMQQAGVHFFDPEAEGAMGAELAQAEVTYPPSGVPDCIDGVDENVWSSRVIYDPVINRRFTLLRPEMDFDRRHKLFPANTHFISRMKLLFSSANAHRFQDAECQSCHKRIRTAVNPAFADRLVYCLSCYNVFIEKNG